MEQQPYNNCMQLTPFHYVAPSFQELAVLCSALMQGAANSGGRFT